MVVCPVALAVGCRKCPVFSVCPVKSVIGDYVPPEKPPSPRAAAAARDAPAAGPAARTAKAKPKAADKPATGGDKRRSSRRRTH